MKKFENIKLRLYINIIISRSHDHTHYYQTKLNFQGTISSFHRRHQPKIVNRDPEAETRRNQVYRTNHPITLEAILVNRRSFSTDSTLTSSRGAASQTV